jgi:malate synthase
MMTHIGKNGLKVAAELAVFVEHQVLPGTGLAPEVFWQGAAAIFEKFVPRNRELLARRDALQAQADAWHKDHRGQSLDVGAYKAFLTEIGYLVPEPAPFSVASANVDAELATMAGPQLVVPVLNARFLLNAANARWGSLYDALYGTDAIPGSAAGSSYDPQRGEQVIAWAKALPKAGQTGRAASCPSLIHLSWSARPVTTCF